MVFPLGTKVVTIGDSLTAAANIASATKVSNQADGIINWALLDTPSLRHGIFYDASDSRNFRGSNHGVSGDSGSMLLARMPTIISSIREQGAKIAVLLIGTNTGTEDTSLGMKIERIDTIIEMLSAEDIHIVLGTVFPRAVTGTGFSSTVSTAYMNTLLAYNEYVRGLASNKVTIWDAWSDLIDPQYTPQDDYYGTPLGDYTIDGVHLSPKGAYEAAQSLKLVLQGLVVSSDLWSGTWFNSSPSQIDNRLLDGSFGGNTGTVGAGMAGVSPTNWTTSITSPTYVSGSGSVSDNTETGGQTFKITLTSTGGGSATGFERCILQPLGFRVNEPAMTSGNWGRLFFKVRVQNPDGALGAVSVVCRNSTSGVFGYGLEPTTGAEGDQPFPVGDYSGWIVSECVEYTTSDVFIPYLQIDTLIGTAGTVTVDVEAALFLEEQNPSLTFSYVGKQSLSSVARFAENFYGIASMQCMGSTAYTPETNPDGIAGSMEIVDNWFKATIRETDPPTATGIRAELTLPTQVIGDEAWFSWEMMVKESEWTDIENGDIIIAQCHPKEGIAASGYFDFYIRPGGRLTFAYPETEPPTEGSYNKTHIDIEDIRFGHVYKFMIHTIWVAEAGRGFLEAFADGVQIYKSHWFGTGYVDDLPYFKLGLYDAPHNADFGTKAARFRNLKRWSGSGPYSTVLGDVPKPKPLLVRNV